MMLTYHGLVGPIVHWFSTVQYDPVIFTSLSHDLNLLVIFSGPAFIGTQAREDRYSVKPWVVRTLFLSLHVLAVVICIFSTVMINNVYHKSGEPLKGILNIWCLVVIYTLLNLLLNFILRRIKSPEQVSDELNEEV